MAPGLPVRVLPRKFPRAVNDETDIGITPAAAVRAVVEIDNRLPLPESTCDCPA
jgi:hypothetical protein